MKTNKKEKKITRIGAGILGTLILALCWVFPYMDGPTNFALSELGFSIVSGIFLLFISIKGKSPIEIFNQSL